MNQLCLGWQTIQFFSCSTSMLLFPPFLMMLQEDIPFLKEEHSGSGADRVSA